MFCIILFSSFSPLSAVSGINHITFVNSPITFVNSDPYYHLPLKIYHLRSCTVSDPRNSCASTFRPRLYTKTGSLKITRSSITFLHETFVDGGDTIIGIFLSALAVLVYRTPAKAYIFQVFFFGRLSWRSTLHFFHN